jgi:hypothetical protein
MSGPWSGSLQERFGKFEALHNSLNGIYGKSSRLVNDVVVVNSSAGSSGSSYFSPSENEIHLSGKLSVVTYLHEYAHTLGKDERQAVRWSLNLFRQVFPDKFATLGRGSGSSGHVVLSQPVRDIPVVSHTRGRV